MTGKAKDQVLGKEAPFCFLPLPGIGDWEFPSGVQTKVGCFPDYLGLFLGFGSVKRLKESFLLFIFSS